MSISSAYISNIFRLRHCPPIRRLRHRAHSARPHETLETTRVHMWPHRVFYSASNTFTPQAMPVMTRIRSRKFCCNNDRTLRIRLGAVPCPTGCAHGKECCLYHQPHRSPPHLPKDEPVVVCRLHLGILRKYPTRHPYL